MRKVFIAIISVIALMLVVVSTVAAHTNRKTCWQSKLTFLNFPSTPDSFARWRMVQGGKHVGHTIVGGRTFAKGEFSFHGDAGGGYQRVVSRCVTGIDPWSNKSIHVTLDYAVYVDCADCKSIAVIRRIS